MAWLLAWQWQRQLCLLRGWQNHCGAQLASFPTGTRGFSLWCKAAGEWSLPVTSIYSSAEDKNEWSHTSMNNFDLLISLQQDISCCHVVCDSVNILTNTWNWTSRRASLSYSIAQRRKPTNNFIFKTSTEEIYLWLVQHSHHANVRWNGGIAPRVLKICSGLSESLDTRAGLFKRLGGSQSWPGRFGWKKCLWEE